jgi:hypothetical protein
MPDLRPGDGNADRLKLYWAQGEGRAKWFGSPHPWRTLNTLLRRHGVPGRQVDGLTTNIFLLAGHPMPDHGHKDKKRG